MNRSGKLWELAKQHLTLRVCNNIIVQDHIPSSRVYHYYRKTCPVQSEPSDLDTSAKTACGGTLKTTDGFPSAMYGGERIYFCTQACLHVFEEHPDDFMAGKIVHPLEDL